MQSFDLTSDHANEKCGIFGVFTKNTPASRLIRAGLCALQHRGQEATGMTVSNGERLSTHKGTGLVACVHNEQVVENLEGSIGIGHNRYATSGASTVDHAQPVTSEKNLVALAHNGNLPVTEKLETFLRLQKINTFGLNDSGLMQRVIEYFLEKGNSVDQAVEKAYPLFTGAFSLVLLTKDTLVGVRDHFGIRPFCIGILSDGEYVLSSETCGLDSIGASYVRDVAPGEMVMIDKNGFRASQLSSGKEKMDIFEMVYFSRPDSYLMGKNVNEVRRRMGLQLAKEFPLPADLVIPVPNSAIPAALGYAKESRIPFDHGILKNSYIHRTFISPIQRLREKDVKMKLVPLPEVLKDKEVIVIDDSIVRGTTSRKLIEMMRLSGARKVHLLSSSPMVKYPDFYGIDTPSQKDLIAARRDISEITKFIGADTVGYLSYKGLLKAIDLPEENFCTSCFTGEYPIDIGFHKKEIDFGV